MQFHGCELLAFLAQAVTLFSGVYLSDAKCRPDQVSECKKAVSEHSLDKLPAGGQCSQRKYVHYTHVCTINDFMPSTDYCCCVDHRSVMCCRYSQDGSVYRCSKTQDEIDTVSRSLRSQLSALHWYWWLAIASATAIASCFLLYCFCKCCCTHYDAEANKVRFHFICCKHKGARSSHSTPELQLYRNPTNIQSQLSKESCDSQRQLLSPESVDPTMPPLPAPTAPPLGADWDTTYTCSRTNSDGHRSPDSSNYECPCRHNGFPPQYGEHVKDRRLK